MGLGGFERMLKVKNGMVVDHRPIGHEDAVGPEWERHMIPVGMDLNIGDEETPVISVESGRPEFTLDGPSLWSDRTILEARIPGEFEDELFLMVADSWDRKGRSKEAYFLRKKIRNKSGK